MIYSLSLCLFLFFSRSSQCKLNFQSTSAAAEKTAAATPQRPKQSFLPRRVDTPDIRDSIPKRREVRCSSKHSQSFSCCCCCCCCCCCSHHCSTQISVLIACDKDIRRCACRGTSCEEPSRRSTTGLSGPTHPHHTGKTQRQRSGGSRKSSLGSAGATPTIQRREDSENAPQNACFSCDSGPDECAWILE